MEMKDWRGNIYKEEELNCKCENCKKKQAVRNCCLAEGDIGRTHWHGCVHIRDAGLMALRKDCADKLQHKNYN